MNLKLILMIAASLTAIIAIILSVVYMLKPQRSKEHGNLLLNAKKCIMGRREHDLYITLKSVLDTDKHCLFYAVPFKNIFSTSHANPDLKLLKSFNNMTADFVVCDKLSLKPQTVILLDHSPDSVGLVISDIEIINLPHREFYTKTEIQAILRRQKVLSGIL
ncbi:MAG: DUF2726 domain-containing protein [Clostridia bacterium]|nr:DUF2726 domain-containing protein [Clostridia bacterium]